MDVIVPQFIGASGYTHSDGDTMGVLLASSIAADTTDVYVPGDPYVIDDEVLYQDKAGQEQGILKLYICIKAYTAGATEAEDNPYINATNWSSLGATERYKMFDYLTLTKTTETTASTDIEIDLYCKAISSIAFINVQAASIEVNVYSGTQSTDKIAGNLITSLSLDLVDDIVDWSDYFFKDFDYVRDISQTLTTGVYHHMVIEIIFEKISGMDCYVGQCIVGRNYDIGDLQQGASTSIQDYSKKDTEATFGYTYLNQGNHKKMLDGDLIIPIEDLNMVNMVLTQLRSIPTVWQGNQDGTEYDNLLLYGFYTNFHIMMAHARHIEYSIEIEGLI